MSEHEEIRRILREIKKETEAIEELLKVTNQLSQSILNQLLR
jgi:phosphomevalonate kinase